jgi:hypothetical protein
MPSLVCSLLVLTALQSVMQGYARYKQYDYRAVSVALWCSSSHSCNCSTLTQP